MCTTDKEYEAMTVQNEQEPVKLLKRIGSTTVEVTVHFSNSSKETMTDIICRMIEREVNKIA